MVGTLELRIVSGNVFHTYAVTITDWAYCWGSEGLLGDGTFTRRLTPVPVLRPS